MKDYNETAKSVNDIAGMISSYFDSPSSEPESLHQALTIRRKLTILVTRLDGLQSALAKLPGNKFMYGSLNREISFSLPQNHENGIDLTVYCESVIRELYTSPGQFYDVEYPLPLHRSEREMNRREDMLSNLRTKVNQMSSILNSSKANRDIFLGPDTKSADAMTRTVCLDNRVLVGLQRQILKDKLLTSVISST